MSRAAKPFTTPRRTDSKTFQITLNSSCGLPDRVCAEWRRRSFQDIHDELSQYRNIKFTPSVKGGIPSIAKTAVLTLINCLKKKQEEGSARRIVIADITVGDWLEKFTRIETSPRAGINAAKNRPFSVDTLDGYRCLFTCHIQGDPIASLKMAEIEEEDILEYMTRLSLKKKIVGRGRKKERQIFLWGEPVPLPAL